MGEDNDRNRDLSAFPHVNVPEEKNPPLIAPDQETFELRARSRYLATITFKEEEVSEERTTRSNSERPFATHR